MPRPQIPSTLTNTQGERLDFTFHSGDPERAEIIVLGHGVTGNKDRPFLVGMAEGWAEQGLNVIRHSWSGNGDSEGNFADSNISKEASDLDAIVGTLTDAGFKVCYAGHSMGGAVGVRQAARDERIRWLVSLAGIVHTKAFAEDAFGDLTPGEGLMFDKEGLILPQAYMDDLNGIGSVIEDTAKIRVPWMLLHGDADDVVPIQDSRDAFARATTTDVQFVELPGVDHTFDPDAVPQVVEKVGAWCRERFDRD
ncbi:lysophospholipase [Opitutaceae bacterium]|jgi:alpha-beta hydrolase superfamily lysophospholipase|nr:lysophospholipase [Opitutaceae bacterium]